MGGEIDVSVVIVLHNSRAYAAEAVCSARAAAAGVRCEWIIVDCGSTDGAAAALAARWPDILLRELPNVGYGRGANVGVAAATGRYVLLLNPDTVWLEGTLAALVGALDAMPDVAVAGVLHRDGDGALKPSVMREPTVRRQLGEALALHHLPGLRRLQEPIAPPAGYDETRDADWLVGAALLVRSSALEQIGGFDPRFFLYSEETDWCVRARRAGWRVVHLPLATIRHDGGGVPADPAAVRHLAASKLAFAAKHFGARRRAAFCTALVARHVLRAAAFAVGALREPASRLRARAELASLAACLSCAVSRGRDGS